MLEHVVVFLSCSNALLLSLLCVFLEQINDDDDEFYLDITGSADIRELSLEYLQTLWTCCDHPPRVSDS